MQVPTIDKLINRVREQSRKISFTKIETDGLHLRRDGRLNTSAGELRLDTSAVPRLAKRVGVPSGFFETCSPALRASVFNEFLQHGLRGERVPSHMKAIIHDGDVLLGVADPDLALLNSAEVLETVLDALPPDLDREHLEVVNFRSNGELRVAVSTPQIVGEPRVGDIVQGGINVRHSPVGGFATQVSSFLFRLVCQNGLLVPTCQHEHRLRIRRAAEENAATTLEKVREVAGIAWTELRSKLDAVQRLAQETVTDPEGLIRAIARQSGLSRRVAAQVISALNVDELGGGDSLFDVINAFARIGTHSERLSSGRRRMLQELSGDLVTERINECPTCGALQRRRYLPEE